MNQRAETIDSYTQTQYIILLENFIMLAEIYEHRSSLPFKIYLLAFLLALVVYFPIQAAKEALSQLRHEHLFINKLNNGPTQSAQLSLQEFLSVLNETTYSGTWSTTLKQSKILTQEEGIIQIKTVTEGNKGEEGHILVIKIYDGNYEEDGCYQIKIGYKSIKSEQKFTENKIVYESTEPTVGEYQKKKIFAHNEPTRLFINRLKFRVIYQDQIKIQMLLAGQYQLNIITSSLTKNHNFLSAFFLSALFTFQTIIQIFGIFQLYEQITVKGNIQRGLSPKTVLLSMCWDVSQMSILGKICSVDEMKFAVFALPFGLSVIMIFILEFKLLSALYKDNALQSQKKSVKYCVPLFGLLIFYISNLHWFLFIFFAAVIMTPQIILNFNLGHRLKYDLSSLIKFICPRFLLLFYIRLFDSNIFHLKPDYLLCIGCFFLISIQIGFLLVQKKFGSRAIMPKFLLPKNFSTFKFFMNEEDDFEFECSICLSSLKHLPENCPVKMEEMIYNKVVVTPCKHKFHYCCLDSWMQTKLQCPNCRRILPPIDQE